MTGLVVDHPHVVERDGAYYVRDGAGNARVPVHRLWAWHRRGTTVETLLKRYPQLGPSRVLDALSFAYDNPQEIDRCLAREEQMLAEQVPSPQQPLKF